MRLYEVCRQHMTEAQLHAWSVRFQECSDKSAARLMLRLGHEGYLNPVFTEQLLEISHGVDMSLARSCADGG